MYTKYKDEKIDKKIGKKGVLLARRDNSKFVRDIYEKVVSMIFEYKNEKEIKDFVIEEINKLCYGYFDYDDFVVTKAVGDSGNARPVKFRDDDGKMKAMVGDYKVKLLPEDKEARDKELQSKGIDNEKEYYLQALPAQVQLAEKMRRRGKRVDNGSRIEYVITTNGGHNAKQGIKVEHIDYFKQFSHILKIDYLYYLKLLTSPLDQILNIFSDDKDFVLKQYKFRLKIREKVLQDIKDLFKPKIVFKKL